MVMKSMVLYNNYNSYLHVVSCVQLHNYNIHAIAQLHGFGETFLRLRTGYTLNQIFTAMYEHFTYQSLDTLYQPIQIL